MSIKELQKYTYISKYSKYVKEAGRREKWEESVERCRDMHIRRFPNLETEIKIAFEMVRQKKVLPSMRSLQFGGSPIEKNNIRLYNCCATYINRLRAIQECMYVLLCGTGAGFSVQKHHIDQLPNLCVHRDILETKTYVIPDSIEGWADAIGVLISSYFSADDAIFPEFAKCDVLFDFGDIRPAGSLLSSGVGKAPGPEPLKTAIVKIRELLDKVIDEGCKKLRPIHVFDIIMHASDAVLSGGIRRCIAKGQKVIIKDQGYKNIEDVRIGDLVSTPNGWQAVTNTFDQGIQETVKIIHQDGELICTPNHRVAVMDGIESFRWKCASELQENDRLVFIRNIASGHKTSLPDFHYTYPSHSSTCKAITIPELDEQMAWFLGFFQANGYAYLTSKSGHICVAVHGDKREQAELIKSIIERFDVNAAIHEPLPNVHCFKIMCKSKQLVQYIHEFLKQPKTTLHIPRCIVEGTQAIRTAFLQGILDSDGSVKTKSQHAVCSVYPEFVKELQNLYGSLGIKTRFKRLSRRYPQWQQKYGLSIINNYDKKFFNLISTVGFKKYKISQHARNANSFPGEWFLKHDIQSNLHNQCCISATITVDAFHKVYQHNRFVPVSVESVEKYQQEQTYDIEVAGDHCFICENVLVHNSACITLFSKDDEEMMQAKTGDWFYTNRQRSRANISVPLIRSETTFEEFNRLFEHTKEFGEPGIVLVDSEEGLFNPCRTLWAPSLIMGKGLKTLGDVQIGDYIWSKHGWSQVTNKWSNGIKKVYKYVTTGGTFYSTDNHRVVCRGQKIEVKDAPGIDTLTGEYAQAVIRPQIVMDGLVLGDGSSGSMKLNIGCNDGDYWDSEISHLILRDGPRQNSKKYEYAVRTRLGLEELPRTFLRRVPDRYKFADRNVICSFLRGLYTANGSICGGRVTLKSASRGLIEDVQLMLSAVGIRSYYTTNKTNTVKFKNGDYVCKESYDLNITGDRDKFAQSIGFIQKYKTEKLTELVSRPKTNSRPKITFDIISSELYSEEEVFDITVDNESHTYWADGFNISNCGEAGFYCYDYEGNAGFQFCNLTSINGKKCKTPEDFYKACEAASLIGTLQAAYTDFGYLGEVTKRITEREALLGVSINGLMDQPHILLDPKVQSAGAKVVKETNEKYAKILGINPAARTTVMKPEGTSSCLLGSASGMRPHHAKRYLRYVQANANENAYKFLQNKNPIACQESYWGSGEGKNKDGIAVFAIEVPDGAKTKDDLSAIEFLKNISSTYKYWIQEGKNPQYCTQDWLSHNISNTVNVREDEWEDVIQYVYNNMDSFCALSFFPISGDKDYVQAPNTTVYTPREIVSMYGNASIFVSGLIESAISAFEHLWFACDALLGIRIIDNPSIQQSIWITKAKKFGDKYFEGDMQKMTYCLKDVFNWKLFTDLQNHMIPVDYSEMLEYEDNTNFDAEAACAGGACLL